MSIHLYTRTMSLIMLTSLWCISAMQQKGVIKYTKEQLMALRNSPYAKGPCEDAQKVIDASFPARSTTRPDLPKFSEERVSRLCYLQVAFQQLKELSSSKKREKLNRYLGPRLELLEREDDDRSFRTEAKKIEKILGKLFFNKQEELVYKLCHSDGDSDSVNVPLTPRDISELEELLQENRYAILTEKMV